MSSIKAPLKPVTIENGTFKAPLIPQFPHSDPSYKCIFGLVHVKFATAVIASISVIGFFISLFWRIISYFNSSHASLGATLLSAVPLLIAGATTIALIVGLIRQQCKILLPFIFVQITAVLASTVFLIMMIIFVACDTRYITDALIGEVDNSSNNRAAKVLLISILALQLLLNIWATRVVCACYRYFDELETFRAYYGHI